MSQASSTIQAFWRLSIMVASLVVGAMGAYVYGPPPERVATVVRGLYDRIAQQATARRGDQPAVAPASETANAAPIVGTPAAVHPRGGSRAAGQYAAATPRPPAEGCGIAGCAGGPSPSPVGRLAEQFSQLGVSEFHLEPWGAGGAWRRFHCTAPLADVAGSRRHFQSIQPTAAAAVAATLEQVRQWRVAARDAAPTQH